MDGADDDAGNHALYRGTLVPDKVSIDDTLNVGYTAKEVLDSCVELLIMAGAIMYENEQGFVHVNLYDTEKELDDDWRMVMMEYDALENPPGPILRF
jgi:hypothetical protein